MTREEKSKLRSELNVKKSKLLDLERLLFDETEIIENQLKENLRIEIIKMEKTLEEK